MTSPQSQLPGWFTVPVVPFAETGVLMHCYQPAANGAEDFFQQVRNATYPRLCVLDDGQVRRLVFFNDKFVQSEMRILAPEALTLEYTRYMMGFLLVNQEPEHVVIVGLGGGSLSKFCYRHLMDCRVTTVELDEDVIACRPWFLIPPDDERMRIVQADASVYFAGQRDGADAILLDAFDAEGTVTQLGNAAFYADVRRHLKPNGVLVANLFGPAASTHVDLLRQCFDDRVVLVEVPQGGNRVAFAFNSPGFPPDWRSMERVARRLDEQHGLDFSHLLHAMQPCDMKKAPEPVTSV